MRTMGILTRRHLLFTWILQSRTIKISLQERKTRQAHQHLWQWMFFMYFLRKKVLIHT